MQVWAATATASLLLALASQSDAHSWLTKPVSRETSGAADVDGSTGCPHMTPGQSTSFKAGETIDVRYWRNNHIGGFVRWSIAPAGNESHDLFDKNAFVYTCRESGATCGPSSDDKWAADGTKENTVSCGDQITLPDWLPAGDYVLQWTWFGAGGKSGNRNSAESNFRSCADIELATAGVKSAAPKCPAFVGGDRSTKIAGRGNDTCFYFHSTDIATSLFKGASVYDYAANYKFGVPSAVEKCSTTGGSSANTTTPEPSSSTPKPTSEVGGDADGSVTPSPTKKHCKAKRGRKRH